MILAALLPVTDDVAAVLGVVTRYLPEPPAVPCHCLDGKLVVIESPYRGPEAAATAERVAYARWAMQDCLQRGEFPLASHLLYTQPGILEDGVPEQRELGIRAGLEWARWADRTVVYLDMGVSDGMRRGISDAELSGRPLVFRRLQPAGTTVSVLHGDRCRLFGVVAPYPSGAPA